MAITRQARVSWEGDLASGKGVVSATTSRVFTRLPVSWETRTKSAHGTTSPEELIAAAHASCFSMALAHELAQAGTPPTRLEVSATVTFGNVEGGWRVVSSVLRVRGRVSRLTAAKFQSAAEAAKENCPVSQALKGNVALSVEAFLER